MRKFYSLFAIAAIAAFGFTSCDDDDDAPVLVPVETSEGAFVVCGGNMGGKIDGSLTYFDYANGTATQNAYKAANGESLGGTVNDAIVYGSKIYIVGSDEKTVFVANKNTLKSVAKIKAEVNGEAVTPRHIAADYGKVFVTTFNNAVIAIDTLTNTIADTYECGNYSEGIAIHNGAIYTADSNYGSGVPGTSITRIDLKSGKSTVIVQDKLSNPVDVKFVQGLMFVLDSGSYDENWNQSGQGVYVVSNDEIEKIVDATEMAVDVNNNKIYTINAPYTYPSTAPSYSVTKLSKGSFDTTKFCDGKEIEYPGKISVDPVKGNVFITSYVMGTGGYADYKAPGYCAIYSTSGAYQGKFDCNVGAGYVIPNTVTTYVQK